LVFARSGKTRTLSFHWYEGTDPMVLEVLRAGLATDQSSLRRPGGAWVVRLTAKIGQTRDAKEKAEAKLHGFAALLGPRLERYLTQKKAPRSEGPARSGS